MVWGLKLLYFMLPERTSVLPSAYKVKKGVDHQPGSTVWLSMHVLKLKFQMYGMQVVSQVGWEFVEYQTHGTNRKYKPGYVATAPGSTLQLQVGFEIQIRPQLHLRFLPTSK